MRRRDLLSLVPAAVVAGCAGRAPGTGGSETPPGNGVMLAGTDFDAGGNTCGRQVDEARVSTTGDRVVVDGTVWGANACHVATLRDASYDPDGDLLVVHVVTTRRDDATACAQCIVEVDYTATCTFDGGLPGTVRVVHGTGDRRTVVTTVDP